MTSVDTQTQLTLTDQITEELAWEITFRRFEPGARLKEMELAARFGVGRPLIREVFQQLEGQGLVEYVPWRGVRVPVLTRTQLSDLFDFIGLIFGFTVKLATDRASGQQLADIEQMIEGMADMVRDGCTPEEYQKARHVTHGLIEKAIGETHDLMSRRPVIRRLRHQFVIDGIKTVAQRRASIKRWQKLLKLMKERNATQAETWAREMVALSKQDALDAHKAWREGTLS